MRRLTSRSEQSELLKARVLLKKTIRMQGGVKVEVTTTTTIKVAGKIWVYRAMPK